MKKCNRCLTKKHHTEFYSNGSKGLKPQCKKCEAKMYAKKTFELSKLDIMINNLLASQWITYEHRQS